MCRWGSLGGERRGVGGGSCHGDGVFALQLQNGNILPGGQRLLRPVIGARSPSLRSNRRATTPPQIPTLAHPPKNKRLR